MIGVGVTVLVNGMMMNREETVMCYRVFVRDWWLYNPDVVGGVEPGPGPRLVIHKHIETEEEARTICHAYNSTHNPGPLSRKAEYESYAPSGASESHQGYESI
jgi:hypothetical protein